jgi:OOP family OmpA-OmpF porin
MKKSMLAIALFAAAVASSAQASSHSPGFYGSLGATASRANADIDRNSTGGTIALGANFNKNFAVEASYADFGKRKIGAADLDATALGLHLVAKVPVCSKAALYVKPGVTQTRVEVAGLSEHKNRVSMGVGALYDVSNRVAVKTEFNHLRDFAGTGRIVNTLTVGLQAGF